MKTSSRWNFRSIGGKIMLGLVLAAMIGSMDVVPALAKDGHKDKGRYEKKGHGHDRGHYVYEHGRRVYRPYGYYVPAPYYAPPPVFYAPPPLQPGISIILPPIYIH